MNNNNNNNTSNNENLFWKVFRNICLNKLIFNQIEDVEWVKINDVSNYHLKNRMKFKHITSLGHIIKHKLYQLLKCKLENGDYIEIDEIGIQLLFLKDDDDDDDGIQLKNNKEKKNEYILKKIMEIGYYRIGDEDKLIKLNDLKLSNKEIEKLNKISAITLLFKYERKLMKTIDFLSTLFKNYHDNNDKSINSNKVINVDMIKFLINEPIFLPITQKTLKNAIKYTSPKIIEILINSPLIEISEKLKNKSISYAFSNFKHREEMMEFILDQPQLYNLVSSNDISVKKLKYSKGSTVTKSQDGYNDDYDGEGDGIVLINLNNAFTIKSKTILDKLHKLNYIVDNIGSLDGGDDDNGKINKEFKEIFKYYSSEEKNIYDNYLILYDEPVDGYDNNQVYNYAINNQSVNSLKYLIKNNFKKDDNHSFNSTKRLKPSKLNYKLISNEFIQHYTFGYVEFKNGDIDEYIIEYMHSIKSNKEYKNVYKSISTDSFRLKVSSNWFDINGKLNVKNNQISNNKSILVKDIETIELIVENIQFIKSYLGGGGINGLNDKILFENCKLLDYAKEKYSLIFRSVNYEYPFTLAIYNCDINHLKQFQELNHFIFGSTRFEKFSNEVELPTFINGEITEHLPGHFGIPFTFKNKNESDLIQLIDYLNSIDYQYFTPNTIEQFINCICSTNGIDLSNLKIKLNLYLYSSLTSVFSDSIERTNLPIVTNFFLNNITNDIKNYKLDFSDYEWNEFVDSTLFIFRKGLFNRYSNYTLFINSNNKVNPFYCTSNDSFSNIKSIIQILLNHLKHHSDYYIEPNTTFQNMINLLFQRVIRINNINFNQVNEIYKLISNEWLSITDGIEKFKFDHCFYHIFYYLGIRSLKFIKLILSIPFIQNIVTEPYSEYCFHPEIKNQIENDNTFSFLDPINVYTFQFIFYSPIQLIFEQLIQDLITQSTIVYENIEIGITERTINSILISIIEIREFNLFFSILDKIKQRDLSQLKFSSKLVKCACISFNYYQFQTFAEFNDYYSIKESILSHNLDSILSKNHCKLISSIVNNHYKINDFKFQ